MDDFSGREENVEIRLSLASMLTALAVLATPVISIRAQAPNPGPSAKAGAPKADASAKDNAPEGVARPTTAEATLESQSKSAGPSSERAAALKKGVQNKKAKVARKQVYRKQQQAYNERRQEVYERQKMQEMILQANRELESARLQAARMEGIERREAEARMSQLETVLSAARATEYQQQRAYLLARDDPEQYQQYEQARLDAYNAQQQALQTLSQTLAQALRERQARQGGSLSYSPSRSAGRSGGTPESPIPSPDRAGQRPRSSDPGPAATTPSQPARPPVQSLADKDRDDQRRMKQRYP